MTIINAKNRQMFAHKQSAKTSPAPIQKMAVPSKGLTLRDNRTNTLQLVRRNHLNFTAKQRNSILTKNRIKNGGYHRCESCGFKHGLRTYATYRGRRVGDGGFQVDHKVPASHGGRPLVRNAAVLCGTCNTSKGNRAHVGKRGIDKYHALHKKHIAKNYLVKKR